MTKLMSGGVGFVLGWLIVLWLVISVMD